MVQIIAPAGWLATGEAAPVPEPMEVAVTAFPTLAGRIVAMLQTHTLLWTAGAATALLAVGLVGFFALSGSDEVAALPQVSPVVATQVEEPTVETPPALADAAVVDIDEAPLASVPAPSLPPVEEVAVAEQAAPPAVEPPTVATAPIVKPEKTRTLTLEPVQEATTSAAVSAPKPVDPVDNEPEYSDDIEAEVAKPEPAPPAAEAPTRITNVKDRLSVPIESIDLPAMPIGEFVKFVSTMAAVRIELDAKVLGEVGLSSHSTVTVRGDQTTVGKLLAGVLNDHQLTCTERDGVLVVVKAKR